MIKDLDTNIADAFGQAIQASLTRSPIGTGCVKETHNTGKETTFLMEDIIYPVIMPTWTNDKPKKLILPYMVKKDSPSNNNTM